MEDIKEFVEKSLEVANMKSEKKQAEKSHKWLSLTWQLPTALNSGSGWRTGWTEVIGKRRTKNGMVHDSE